MDKKRRTELAEKTGGRGALYKEITRYSYWQTAGQLPYLSDRSIANYKKMRYHPMIAMGLNFTTLGLTEVPRTVVCSDEEVGVITDRMLDRIWKQLLRDAFECLIYGFKPMEIRYEPGALRYKLTPDDTEEKTFTGILLRQPKALDPEYIRILVEEDGSLRGFKQDYSTQPVLVEDRKCLIFINNLESGNYYGTSALEMVYSSWYISSINMQFHTRWLERKGTGLFVGRYPVGKDDQGVDNSETMNDILDAIMEGTTVALPSGADEHGNPFWDIFLLDSTDKTDSFIGFHEYLDKMILRGLIIPERALTQGEIGARASVEAFADTFTDRRQDILNVAVDYISRYLVKNFVELNFGSGIEISVSAGRIDDKSKQNAYTLIEKLVEQGRVELDHKWLVEKTGIPITEKEAETVVEKFYKEEEAEQSGEPEEDTGAPPEENAEGQEKKPGGKTKLAEMGPDRWSALTAREKQFGLSGLSGYLDQRSAGFQADLRRLLTEQRDRIKGYLTKNIGTGRPWEVAGEIKIQPAPIKRMFTDFLNEVYRYAYEQFQRGTGQAAMFGEESAFIGFRVMLSADKLINDLETAIKHAVAESISRGASPAEILQNYEASFDTFLSGRLSNIAETEVGFTLNKANSMTLALNKKLVANGTLDPDQAIKRVQYTAIMDSATCPLCGGLHGMVVPADSPIVGKYSPPLHYFCRCIWMPITQAEIDNPRVADTELSRDSNTGKPYTSDGLTASLGADIHYRTF